MIFIISLLHMIDNHILKLSPTALQRKVRRIFNQLYCKYVKVCYIISMTGIEILAKYFLCLANYWGIGTNTQTVCHRQRNFVKIISSLKFLC